MLFFDRRIRGLLDWGVWVGMLLNDTLIEQLVAFVILFAATCQSIPLAGAQVRGWPPFSSSELG